MTDPDQRAIRAAYHAIKAISWINDNPHQPVPTALLKPAMESSADYFIDQLLERAGAYLRLARTVPEPPDSNDTEPDDPSEPQD